MSFEERREEEISESYQAVLRSKPRTRAGLWKREDLLPRLESDLMNAHQAERERAGQREVAKLLQMAGYPPNY